MSKTLITICARGGSQGLPGKNILPLEGKPLITHTIAQAQKWGKAEFLLVSTDSEEIASIAKNAGADVPFLRSPELSGPEVGKLKVIRDALEKAEQETGKVFDQVLDLDVTSPVRTSQDIEKGFQQFQETGADVCFSVVKARKNPYFNMVERNKGGGVELVKGSDFVSRQSAPTVWEMNASIYFFRTEFLKSNPHHIWDGRCEFFEMPAYSAFDIDEETDFLVAEQMMKLLRKGELNA